jgi:transcriptional regulator with XRE-family HTH domain
MRQNVDLKFARALGLLIRQRIAERGFVSHEFADENGISRTTLWRAESCKHSVTIDTLRAIAKALDTTAGELLSAAEEKLK